MKKRKGDTNKGMHIEEATWPMIGDNHQSTWTRFLTIKKKMSMTLMKEYLKPFLVKPIVECQIEAFVGGVSWIVSWADNPVRLRQNAT